MIKLGDKFQCLRTKAYTRLATVTQVKGDRIHLEMDDGSCWAEMTEKEALAKDSCVRRVEVKVK